MSQVFTLAIGTADNDHDNNPTSFVFALLLLRHGHLMQCRRPVFDWCDVSFFKYVHSNHYYGHGGSSKQQQQCLVCYNNTLMCSMFAAGNAFLCLLEVQLYRGYYLLVHETGLLGMVAPVLLMALEVGRCTGHCRRYWRTSIWWLICLSFTAVSCASKLTSLLWRSWCNYFDVNVGSLCWIYHSLKLEICCQRSESVPSSFKDRNKYTMKK